MTMDNPFNLNIGSTRTPTYNVHGMRIGTSFKTQQAVMSNLMQLEARDAGSSEDQFAKDETAATNPTYYTQPNMSDTTLGGNDVLNPYAQYSRNDDVIHPLTSTDGGRCKRGMGRIYSESHDLGQQILWMSFGVPEYAGAAKFMFKAADSGLAEFLNSGNGSAAFAAKIGSMLGSVGRLAITLPVLPIIWMNKLLQIANKEPVTKYYDFKIASLIHFRMMNVILSNLSVGMGIYANGDNDLKNDARYGKMYSEAGLPECLKKGPDIFAIMDKRGSRLKNKDPRTLDEYMKEMARPEDERGEGFFDKFTGAVANSALSANDFIGFRVEKSTEASESVSNSTGQSQIAEKLNGAASAAREKNFMLSGAKSGIGILDSVTGAMGGFFQGALSGVGFGGAVEAATGNGFFDIPEVWKSSEFTKTHNFSIQLRSRYGDPVSIFQNIYVPLAALLAAALPQSIGPNMYKSPMLIKAYCKGMFAINLGMIDSMQIKRGSAEFGWSVHNLPTAVDVTLSIKDLSPAMFLNIAEPGFFDMFKQNSSLQEYLTTLSGVGLAERYFIGPRLKRKWASSVLIRKNTTFSPIYWGNKVGRSGLARTVTAVVPWSHVRNN